MQQGVLLGAMRNCDGVRSEGPHKTLIRGIRAACIKSAQTKGSFNARRPKVDTLPDAAREFVDKLYDELPMHFVTHLMHAAEVLGYAHPDGAISMCWLEVYKTIVDALHLRVESFEQFKERLKDDPEQVKREDLFDEKCFNSGKYGNGTGTVNEGDIA
jgi:hypothetical protein